MVAHTKDEAVFEWEQSRINIAEKPTLTFGKHYALGIHENKDRLKLGISIDSKDVYADLLSCFQFECVIIDIPRLVELADDRCRQQHLLGPARRIVPFNLLDLGEEIDDVIGSR